MLAGALAIIAASHSPASAEAPRLAGYFEPTTEISSRWGWAGAWLYPVGDPHDFTRPHGALSGYHLLRGLERDGREGGHQGADLGNGSGGGVVRAAAQGLIVHVAPDSTNSGYGRHVVIAHRLEDGSIVYSVYAHLRPRSIRVRAGEHVGAGAVIGCVGRSGRASTEHLHFEIRIARDPSERWEKQPVADPMAFVAERLPTPRADSAWMAPYLEWAELAGLIPHGQTGEERLTRSAWRALLARIARHPMEKLPSDPESLRADLIGASVIPQESVPIGEDGVTWAELSRDLSHLGTLGVRPGPPRIEGAALRDNCRRYLGAESLASNPAALRNHPDPPPALMAALIACATLCRSARGAKSSKHHHRDQIFLTAPAAHVRVRPHLKAVTGTSTRAAGASEPGAV